MWDAFFQQYRAIKGASTKASSLDKVIRLLDGYDRDGNGRARIREVKSELTKVKKAWRLIGDNPAIKYALPISMLEAEMYLEEKIIAEHTATAAAAVGARARAQGRAATAAAPTAPTASAPAGGTIDELNATGNVRRMRVQYAAVLSKQVSEPEHMRAIESAFAGLCREPKFGKYFLDETGWTNARAWATWALRAATPDMLGGASARDATEFLRGVALRAGVLGKPYAERYLLELSIYCQAQADKADVGFVMGQATSLLGVLVGPILSAALGSGVLGTAAKGVKAAAELGATKGAQAATTDTVEERDIAISEGDKEKVTAINVMRFTHAWLRYVTEERSPSAHARVVLKEFGGVRGCESLLDELLEM